MGNSKRLFTQQTQKIMVNSGDPTQVDTHKIKKGWKQSEADGKRNRNHAVKVTVNKTRKV